VRQFAGCFTDHRRSDKIEHSVEELLAQRIYGLALGYEDLNDHDQTRAVTFFLPSRGTGSRRLSLADFSNQRGKNFVQVSHYAVIGPPEERGIPVLVNDQNVFGSLAAYQVLDRTTDSAGDI
jgi:hypothetical protein